MFWAAKRRPDSGAGGLAAEIGLPVTPRTNFRQQRPGDADGAERGCARRTNRSRSALRLVLRIQPRSALSPTLLLTAEALFS